MACRCGSTALLRLSGKCADMCSATIGETTGEGYAPYIDGLGGGAYIRLTVCIECGTLQDFAPLTADDAAEAVSGM